MDIEEDIEKIFIPIWIVIYASVGVYIGIRDFTLEFSFGAIFMTLVVLLLVIFGAIPITIPFVGLSCMLASPIYHFNLSKVWRWIIALICSSIVAIGSFYFFKFTSSCSKQSEPNKYYYEDYYPLHDDEEYIFHLEPR